MEELFNTIRKNCSSVIWSRGVELARNNAVLEERKTAEAIELRVATQGGIISPQVILYLEDNEWTCECSSREDVCLHVAASIIALRKAKTEGLVLGTYVKPQALPPGKITYHFTASNEGLLFERFVVQADKSTVLTTTLSAIAQKKVQGPQFVASQTDLQIELILGTHLRGLLPRATLAKVFAALIDHDDVFFNNEKVQVKDTLNGLYAKVEDRFEDYLVWLLQDASIEQIFANGAALKQKSLHALRDIDLSSTLVQECRKGKLFRKEQVIELVSDFIPKLKKHVPVEIVSTKIPELSPYATPQLIFETTREDDTLGVFVTLVYGDPPLARVDGDKLTHLQGAIPMRDIDEEKRLQRQVYNLKLALGQKTILTGKAAVNLASTLEQHQEHQEFKLLNTAYKAFYLAAPLVPQVNGFDISFTSPANAKTSGGKVSAEAVLKAWHQGENLVPLLEGGMAPLPLDWLQRYGTQINDLLAAKALNQQTLPKALYPQAVKLFQDLNQPIPHELKQLETLVNDFSALPKAELPSDLTAELRTYQQEGVNWLCFMQKAGLGALLADDMGLGKTLQAICAIRGRTLIVVPTSVLTNWQDECKKFRPSLQCHLYYGNKRKLEDNGITLTTYALLRLDIETLSAVHWDTIILDEAQAIKNVDSQVAQAAYRLKGNFKLTLTGTPVENRLDELWSQFHFSNQGLLGGLNDFQDRYVKPILSGDSAIAAHLRERLKPFILRRLKQNVAKELPPRTDIILRCELSEEEQQIYQAIKAASLDKVMSELEQSGNVLQALELLLRLRQACCHAALVPGQKITASAKLTLLLETLNETLSENHRSLIFSQWTSLLDLLEPELQRANIKYLRLDGSTQNRGEIVKQFQENTENKVLLISLKAGGTGLNLTGADHVFLLDPWWNPAVEDQAADRAHRIGQTKPVFVHRLIAQDTVEERILALQQSKRDLAQAALEDADYASQLSKHDLLELLKSA